MAPDFFRFSKRDTFLKVLALFFALIIGGLVTIDILFARAGKEFNAATTWVTHTRDVINRLDSIFILAQNLQWETRNYSLPADSFVYETYFSIRNSLIERSASFKKDVADNKNQYANAAQLEKQIAILIRFTDSSVRSKKDFSEFPALFLPGVRQHISLHNSIDRQIQNIKKEEVYLLSRRSANAIGRIGFVYTIYESSAILILLLLVGTFTFIFYHFRKRQQAEKSVMESERKFQTLINSTRDLAIFTIDENGKIMDWYAGANKMKGYQRDEVIGKNVSIFYPIEAIENREPQRNLEIAARDGSYETEGWRVRKDGSRFWADVLINAVYEDGKVKGFTKVTRDFSLHKSAEEEVRSLLEKEKDLNRMKSNFVSIASHEFRTPLSTILSSISLIEKYRTTDTQEKREQHINRIKSSIKELVSTLDEFLSLEKIEEGKVQPKNDFFNLRELSEHLHAKFNSILKPGQRITYKHIGKEDVFLDEEFITHILNNLLSNAVKYSPDSTQIRFETCIASGHLIVKIKDEGIGISKEDQKHLFERFFRASNTGSIKGTGLGLHITKRFVDLMGGEISVTSEINEGTQFDVKVKASQMPD